MIITIPQMKNFPWAEGDNQQKRKKITEITAGLTEIFKNVETGIEFPENNYAKKVLIRIESFEYDAMMIARKERKKIDKILKGTPATIFTGRTTRRL